MRVRGGCGSATLAKQNRSIDLSAGILISILNTVKIIMIAKIQRKKRTYELILIVLPESDSMFGFLNVIVSLSHSCKQANLLEIVYVISVFFVLTLIIHLTYIAVDRTMIFQIPFKYETVFTRKKPKTGISIRWMLALLV